MSDAILPGSRSPIAHPADARGAASAQSHAAALELRGVSFSYGRDSLFEGFDLSVDEGVFTGVLGPNGCGKSTALKLAAGLLAPRRGEALIGEGMRVATLPARDRALRMSYLPQRMPLPPMTVGELALCGRHAHRRLLAPLDARDERAAQAAMERAGVSHLRDRRVSELSGGQRQRAYLAMMLAQDALLMLLDEPTSALDVGAAHEVLSLVRSLVREEGRTVVAVLHDLDLALRYCDRIVVMDAGRVIFQGEPSDAAGHAALARAFGVSVAEHDAPEGPCYTFHRWS